ncbi:GFA family protein [bacterium]|nr:GFA family protein [bacterium]
MEKIFKGSCQCQDVKYKVTGSPLTLFVCHCTECQKQSASAFGMALWIRQKEVELISGELKTWVRTMPSGRKMACDFCPNCGTRIFHRQVDKAEMISIKPGTLDDTSLLKPVGHIWKKSAQPWIKFEDDCLQFDGNPDSYDEMIRLFSCKS